MTEEEIESKTCQLQDIEEMLGQIIVQYPALAKQSSHTRPIVDWYAAAVVQAQLQKYKAQITFGQVT